MQKEFITVLSEETARQLIALLEKYRQDLSKASSREVYDNHGLMDLLGIGDKYIKKLRDNGHIGYTRYGDKYWYSKADVEAFLKTYHYEAFAQKVTMFASD